MAPCQGNPEVLWKSEIRSTKSEISTNLKIRISKQNSFGFLICFGLVLDGRFARYSGFEFDNSTSNLTSLAGIQIRWHHPYLSSFSPYWIPVISS